MAEVNRIRPLGEVDVVSEHCEVYNGGRHKFEQTRNEFCETACRERQRVAGCQPVREKTLKQVQGDRGKCNSPAPCGDKNIFNLLTFHCKNQAKSCHSEVQISEIPRLLLFDTEICTVESPIAQSMKSYVLGRYAQPTLCNTEHIS